MPTAMPRPNWTPGGGQSLEDWMTAELARNPTYQLPRGYHVENGRVVRDEPNWFLRHPWTIPALGIGGGAALSAVGALGPAAGATGYTSAGYVSPYASAGGASGAGATSTAAAAGLTGNRLIDAAIRAGVPLATTLLATRRRPGAETGTGLPADLEGQLRELLQLQVRRAERTEPVHEAAVQLAQRLAPTGPDPRIQDAAARSQTPRAAMQTNPQVLEAVRRLMGQV